MSQVRSVYKSYLGHLTPKSKRIHHNVCGQTLHHLSRSNYFWKRKETYLCPQRERNYKWVPNLQIFCPCRS